MSLSQTLPGTQNTDLVTFTIKVNGTVLGASYQVASMNFSKEINRIPVAKLLIYDGDASAQDFALSNQPTLVPGAEIEIAVGYHADEATLFNGIILKHSLKIRGNGSPMLILDCRDKAIKMTVARKNKYFYDTKDSDAITGIIGNYGLSTDIEDTSTTLKAIVQYDSTDWDFMVSRMEANGKLCIVDNGKITAKKPDFSSTTVLDALFGATMLEFDADLDARNQYQSLTAKTWDYTTQEIATASAAEPGFEENGNISSSDLGAVLSVSEYDLYSGEDLTSDELQSLADGRLQKARMSRCRGRVRFRGYGGQLNPGDLINIGGVGDRFNGKVFVSGVRHEIVNGSWTTDVQFGLSNELFTRQPDVNSAPAVDMLPAIQGLQIGIVTDLENDPDTQDRIRVRLPIIDPAEDGIWTRIACLDAGNNRGTFFRPEIGDEVVVGFLNNDPRHPVVLGMLNSSTKPAPLKAANKNDEKGYTSRSGMKMIFNDDEKSLKIETPAGKKVTISEKEGYIQLEDENNNKVTMDSSAISLQSGADIKLKATGDLTIEAVNISLSPSSSFSVSAGGSSIKADSGSAAISAPSVKVEGSGTATIKGGIVMIN
ncbi:type VI secretion system tip protein VgrG [Mucilaginibacter lappiensis]|uniref:Rhs element Vgr protein n=1 Tax=Mucilaginibacter lappiensis TaxID=354630 RepID=A0A1N6WTG7_9SPHI|nr:type VI secretion system tip protein VgrG [Mucilaginibacter lappiensis]MBB6109489.1 Rhs element Vgr protein [Mucilaginibacter lappiensis]MBB6127727.1 Rhs element Vgr protein [Mucilaginibacter lappiensis]SIQ93306.1 Rhs element Vgr protein [Mucilaginibacter lappiensis]